MRGLATQKRNRKRLNDEGMGFTHTRMTKRGSRRTSERDWMPRVIAATPATANERCADFSNVKRDRKERKKK